MSDVEYGPHLALSLPRSQPDTAEHPDESIETGTLVVGPFAYVGLAYGVLRVNVCACCDDLDLTMRNGMLYCDGKWWADVFVVGAASGAEEPTKELFTPRDV